MAAFSSFLRKSGIGNVAFVALMALISSGLAFLFAKNGVITAMLVIVFVLAGIIFILTISDFRIGFLILITYSFFLFQIGRMLPGDLAMGMFIEIFLVLIFLGISLEHFKNGTNGWHVFKNPVGYGILLFCGFVVLGLLNPNSTSISAKSMSIREMMSFLVSYYVVMHVFTSFKITINFTKFWLFLGVLVLLYAMKQEYLGFSDSEWHMLNSNPLAKRMAFIAGRWRKWSFLSDISSYGLFSSYMGIVCFILALGPFKMTNKLILGFLAMLAFYAGSFSGTRTAWAIIPIGIFLYFFMNIHDKRVLAIAVVSVAGLLFLVFGPIHGGTVSRIRTTINPDKDASMEVRDLKRIRLQPYIHSHPIGGGINTAGNNGIRFEPGHRLAGRYDPDSGYLRLALERGWIGLLIALYLYFIIMVTGVKNYYNCRDPKIRIFYAAYMCGFFALIIANFTQDALDQKPINFLLVSSYAMMTRLKEFDSSSKEIPEKA